MTTSLVAISDMERMAQAIAKSGLFGMKTVDQTLALMLIAQAEGRHPAIVARDYDIIQGRPAKKAEAMLRDFLEAGGKVEWHQLDDGIADATFSHPQGGTARISWDMARAQRAGLVAKGGDMYKKYGRQMLRSRTVSEGCKTVYPAATSGMYEPTEVRQIMREEKKAEKDMGPAEVVEPDPEDEALKGLEQAPAPTMPTEAPKTRSDVLTELCRDAGYNLIDLLAKADVAHAEEMSDADFESAKTMLRRRITKRMVAETAAAQP